MTALLVSLIFIVLAGAVLALHGLEQRPTQRVTVRVPILQRSLIQSPPVSTSQTHREEK